MLLAAASHEGANIRRRQCIYARQAWAPSLIFREERNELPEVTAISFDAQGRQPALDG